MKITNAVILAGVAIFGAALFQLQAEEFDLDAFLKQMESELQTKPVAKKEPAATPPPTSTPTQTTMHDDREEKIINFFQNKIVPIADGLFKLIESKETQQLVDTAKKNRLEREKTIAAKVTKNASQGPRSSSSGSSFRGYNRGYSGYDGYGGYGGYGGYNSGYGGYPSYGNSGYDAYGNPISQNWNQDQSSSSPSSEPSTSPLAESPEPEKKKEESIRGDLGTQEKEDKESLLTAQKRATRLSDELMKSLEKANKTFERTKQDSLTQPLVAQTVAPLQKQLEARNNVMDMLDTKEVNDIKNKERSAWHKLLAYIDGFKSDYQKIIKEARSEAENLSKIVLRSPGSPATKSLEEMLEKLYTKYPNPAIQEALAVLGKHPENLAQAPMDMTEIKNLLDAAKAEIDGLKEEAQQSPDKDLSLDNLVNQLTVIEQKYPNEQTKKALALLKKQPEGANTQSTTVDTHRAQKNPKQREEAPFPQTYIQAFLTEEEESFPPTYTQTALPKPNAEKQTAEKIKTLIKIDFDALTKALNDLKTELAQREIQETKAPKKEPQASTPVDFESIMNTLDQAPCLDEATEAFIDEVQTFLEPTKELPQNLPIVK